MSAVLGHATFDHVYLYVGISGTDLVEHDLVLLDDHPVSDLLDAAFQFADRLKQVGELLRKGLLVLRYPPVLQILSRRHKTVLNEIGACDCYRLTKPRLKSCDQNDEL